MVKLADCIHRLTIIDLYDAYMIAYDHNSEKYYSIGYVAEPSGVMLSNKWIEVKYTLHMDKESYVAT